MDNAEKMLELKTWAVVGANNNKEKFGYKIFDFLEQTGKYIVYPVNPGLTEVKGKKCYPTVKDLPERPDVVNFVVPPRVGEQVVRDCAEAGIANIWLQPGTSSPAVIALAQELGLTVTLGCVMRKLSPNG